MRRTSLFEAVPAHERKPAGLPGQRGASANRSGILRDIYIRDLGKEHSQKLDVRARKLDSITTNAAKTLTDAKPKFRASEGLNKLVNYLSIQTAGKVKKIIRDKGGHLNVGDIDQIGDELGDVLWYIAALCNELGLSMGTIAAGNLDKLASRMDRGKIGGSGDDR